MHVRNIVVSAMAVSLLGFFGVARAQNAPPPAGPGRQGGPGAGEHRRFDPAEMHQRYLDHIKEALGVGDKEWGAIQPALEEVVNLSRDIGGGGMFGRRGRHTEAPENAKEPQSAVAKAEQELRTTLENKAATPDEIKAKVTALRDAREKAKKELTTSKEALREMLTPRQEAQLVLMGILE